MSDSQMPPPAGETQAAPDPEIEELLKFEPAPRKFKRQDGWTAPLQRKFIFHLAQTGSPALAARALGKDRFGIEKIYKSPDSGSFRAAWDRAIEIFEERAAERIEAEHRETWSLKAPAVDRRRKPPSSAAAGPLPGQVMNEQGEWEDEGPLMARVDEAKDSISQKLLYCRRLYLREICDCPGKRAAFEILTELPIDWEKARRLEPQPDEPWNRANQRQPDMILTAESGWTFGEAGYGPDRKAEARKAIDEYRAEEGLEPVEWEEEEGAPSPSSPTPIEDPASSPSPTPEDKSGPRVRRM